MSNSPNKEPDAPNKEPETSVSGLSRKKSLSALHPEADASGSLGDVQNIPFEFQRIKPGRRCCGAAALSMIYRSFGLPVEQADIQKELESYAPGAENVRTFHLARNALEKGFAALPVRLRSPRNFLAFLVQTETETIRTVLNHRLQADSPLGHFTVFLGLDPITETVRTHDPQFGPDRVLRLSELLELWTPPKGSKIPSEITGNVAVLFAEKGTETRNCPKCDRQFLIEPFRSLGNDPFAAVFCPWCDARIAPF